MTISTTTRRAGPFAGNGVTTAFAFGFKVYSAADVLVVLTANGVDTFPLLTTNYTVTLNADQNTAPGGTVTMLVAPPVGTSLLIGSRIAQTQPTDFSNAGGFYPKIVTEALDRITALVQQTAEQIARAALSPFSDSPTTLVWPRAATRPNKLVAFDASGQLAVTTFDAGTLATFLAGARPVALPGQNVAVNYAAMTALLKANLSDGLTVVLTGGAARGDGLGGVFYWDAASVLAPDGSNTFAANEGGSGRWRRAPFPNSNTFATLSTTGLATLNSLSVTGNATIGGSLTLVGDLPVTGNLTVGGTVNVGGGTAFNSFVNVQGAFTALGLSFFTGLATFNGRAQFNDAAHTPRVGIAAAASTTIDCLQSNVFSISMGANITTLTVSNPQDGQTLNVRFKQDGTGGRTAAWPSSFKWPGGVVPTLSTAANARDLLVLTYWADEGFFDASLLKGLA